MGNFTCCSPAARAYFFATSSYFAVGNKRVFFFVLSQSPSPLLPYRLIFPAWLNKPSQEIARRKDIPGLLGHRLQVQPRVAPPVNLGDSGGYIQSF